MWPDSAMIGWVLCLAREGILLRANFPSWHVAPLNAQCLHAWYAMDISIAAAAQSPYRLTEHWAIGH